MGIFCRLLTLQSNSLLLISVRQYSKVPKLPHIASITRKVTNESVDIELSSVRYLERLSLVNFGNQEGIRILASSIKFAENLLLKDTKGIKPLSTVLENSTISLREDIVTEGNNRDVVMNNAKVTEEEYFVAPPGNIPVEPDESLQKYINQKVKMREKLKKFLDVTCKYGFLKKDKDEIIFGPMAQLLANNIRRGWLKDSVTQSDNVSHINDNPDIKWQDDCFPSFHQRLQLGDEKLPFELVFILTDVPTPRNELVVQSNCLFQSKTNLYRCLRFIDPNKSQKYFYRLQRSRNIWWRKFARDPEVFQINEAKRDQDNEAVEIVAKLPWIEQTVETIHNHGSKPLERFGAMFEVKIERKRVLPHVVESVCLEAPATVAYLWDAFQQLQSRTVLRFHPRLTPYKAAVVIDTEDKVLEELKLLADFLNLSLRKAGLHTLSSSNEHVEDSVDSQFTKHDLLGIPYTLVIKDNTLSNGIAGLRSRDTTLQEQVHISRVTSYMQRLFGK